MEYAEVQFYFLCFAGDSDSDELVPRALVSVYSRPVQHLLDDSCQTLWACKYSGVDDLRVVETSKIQSVVSVQPLPPLPGEPDNLWFIIGKSGLDDAELTGHEEPMEDRNDQGGEDIIL
jgi:hypothetical protein